MDPLPEIEHVQTIRQTRATLELRLAQSPTNGHKGNHNSKIAEGCDRRGGVRPVGPAAIVGGARSAHAGLQVVGEVAGLQAFLDGDQESGRVGAVDDAVVIAERQVAPSSGER